MKNEQINNKNNNNYIERYNNFMDGLEELSKKYGIVIQACGCFNYFDLNDKNDIDKLQNLKYDRDFDSGDIMSNIYDNIDK